MAVQMQGQGEGRGQEQGDEVQMLRSRVAALSEAFDTVADVVVQEVDAIRRAMSALRDEVLEQARADARAEAAQVVDKVMTQLQRPLEARIDARCDRLERRLEAQRQKQDTDATAHTVAASSTATAVDQLGAGVEALREEVSRLARE